MDFKILILGIFAFMTFGVSAQEDSLILTKNYQFKDGVYLSFDAFQSNTPDYEWDDLKANLVTNPQTFLTQIEYIYIKDEEGDIPLPLSSIWCVSLAGIPYLQLNEIEVKKGLMSFAGLQLRGKICYYSFEDYRTVQIPMHAYNPYTGRPFRSGIVEREKNVTFERILNFETGEIAELNIENLKIWIKEDQKLLDTMNSLSLIELEDKLFKCLLIYDDRNVVRIKKFKEVDSEISEDVMELVPNEGKAEDGNSSEQ